MSINSESLMLSWHAREGAFSTWRHSGTREDGSRFLCLDVESAASCMDPYGPGGYLGREFYNGAQYLIGEATSDLFTVKHHLHEVIASWAAVTPRGTWLEVLIRLQAGRVWGDWHSFGVWADRNDTIQRHSVLDQADSLCRIDVDTLIVTTEIPVNTAQVKVRLFSADKAVTPALRDVYLVVDRPPPLADVTTDYTYLGETFEIDVPCYSQMIYPDGGKVWCSPTSVAMVLDYWRGERSDPEFSVRSAVEAVFDWAYDGWGNWTFNTAYAASLGFSSYVTRMTTLTDVERWVRSGVPIIISYGWGAGELYNAPLPSSRGHLGVVVGFDASGNPILNDPAARSASQVRRIYRRTELERLWHRHSSATAYVIHNCGKPARI